MFIPQTHQSEIGILRRYFQSSESTYSCELNTQNPTIICDAYFAIFRLLGWKMKTKEEAVHVL